MRVERLGLDKSSLRMRVLGSECLMQTPHIYSGAGL